MAYNCWDEIESFFKLKTLLENEGLIFGIEITMLYMCTVHFDVLKSK